MQKPATTESPVHPLITNRWSPRAFDSDKPITTAVRTALLEAARWSPSCFGAEPWRFVVCDKNTHSDAWEKAKNCLVELNQVWAQCAPLLILVCANRQYANGNDNHHHAYDTGAAMMALSLEAENQGLRVHQMGGFDAQTARTAFHVPEQCACLAMVAIGYQADADTLDNDQLKQREKAPRQRKPLSENFFLGDWGGERA